MMKQMDRLKPYCWQVLSSSVTCRPTTLSLSLVLLTRRPRRAYHLLFFDPRLHSSRVSVPVPHRCQVANVIRQRIMWSKQLTMKFSPRVSSLDRRQAEFQGMAEASCEKWCDNDDKGLPVSWLWQQSHPVWVAIALNLLLGHLVCTVHLKIHKLCVTAYARSIWIASQSPKSTV